MVDMIVRWNVQTESIEEMMDRITRQGPPRCTALVDQGATWGWETVMVKCSNPATKKYWHRGGYWNVCRRCLSKTVYQNGVITLPAYEGKYASGN